MTKIIVKDRQGDVQELSADMGLTLMEIIRDAGMDIEAVEVVALVQLVTYMLIKIGSQNYQLGKMMKNLCLIKLLMFKIIPD